MAGMSISWTGVEQVDRKMQGYGAALEEVPYRVALYYEPQVENAAKHHAPWTDQTGNARQALRARAERLGRGRAVLFLYHGMAYGVHLELRNQGRYAVIMPTLRSFYPRVRQTLREVTR